MSGSKKDLMKALQCAMEAEDEKDGGDSRRLCRSEECECFLHGEHALRASAHHAS